MHPLWLAALLAAILASATGIATFADAEDSSLKQQRIEGPLRAFGKATTWLNSEPLAAQALRGKVVLVDFWTYSSMPRGAFAISSSAKAITTRRKK